MLLQLLLLQSYYATKTHIRTPTRPPSYKRLKPFYKKINNLIVAIYYIKDLLLKDF